MVTEFFVVLAFFFIMFDSEIEAAKARRRFLRARVV